MVLKLLMISSMAAAAASTACWGPVISQSRVSFLTLICAPVRSRRVRMFCPPLPMMRDSTPAQGTILVAPPATGCESPATYPDPPDASAALAVSMMVRISAAHCSAPAPDTSVTPWSFLTWIRTWYVSCILMMFCPPRPMMRPSWPAVWSVIGGASPPGPAAPSGAGGAAPSGAAPSAGGASKPEVRWRCAGFSKASGGSMSSPSRSRLTPRSSSPPDMAAALSAMACALAFMASKSIAAAAAGAAASGSASAGGAAGSGSGSAGAAASGSGAAAVGASGSGS